MIEFIINLGQFAIGLILFCVGLAVIAGIGYLTIFKPILWVYHKTLGLWNMAVEDCNEAINTLKAWYIKRIHN